jgi:hypothetical protein
LFSKITSGASCVEFDKLNDIAAGLPSRVISQSLLITIKLMHHSKIGLSHSYDNNRAGKRGKVAENRLGASHIVNGSIS